MDVSMGRGQNFQFKRSFKDALNAILMERMEKILKDFYGLKPKGTPFNSENGITGMKGNAPRNNMERNLDRNQEN